MCVGAWNGRTTGWHYLVPQKFKWNSNSASASGHGARHPPRRPAREYNERRSEIRVIKAFNSMWVASYCLRFRRIRADFRGRKMKNLQSEYTFSVWLHPHLLFHVRRSAGRAKRLRRSHKWGEKRGKYIETVYYVQTDCMNRLKYGEKLR